jgi:hypothetical protein
LFALDDRGQRAKEFLRSESARRLAAWDGQARRSAEGEIDVYFQLAWRDGARAARAWELLDREIRRCARALDLFVRGHGGGKEQDAVLGSPRWLEQALAQQAAPVASGGSGLILMEVQGPPLTLQLEPQGAARELFAIAPALTLGYVMHVFGVPFHVERLWGSPHPSRNPVLPAVSQFLQSGSVPFEVAGGEQMLADDLTRANLRAISRGSLDPATRDVRLAVFRTAGGGLDCHQAWLQLAQ